MNEHTNEHTKTRRQSTSKERNAARHTRGESKYRLELLESRLLLSADIIAAVPPAPVSTPQPTMTVAEMLARPVSSFPQEASPISLPSPQKGAGPSLPQPALQASAGVQPVDGGSVAGKAPISVADLLTQISTTKGGPGVKVPGPQNPAPPMPPVIQPTAPPAEVNSPTDTATSGPIAAPVTAPSPSPIVATPVSTPPPPTTVAEILAPSSPSSSPVDSAVILPSPQTGSGSSILQLQPAPTPSDAQPVDGGSSVNQPVAVTYLLTQPSSKSGSSVSLAGSQDPATAPAPQTSPVVQPAAPTSEVTSPTDTATSEPIVPVTAPSPSPDAVLPDTGGTLQPPTITTPSTAGGQPIASTLLDQWRQQMVTFGRQHAGELAGLTGQAAVNATYYDAARVFYQIADYTHDPSWLAPAHQAVTIYRDQYVVPSNGTVPGYWNFTGGLLEDFQHTGDVRSKDAIIMLSQNASFAPDNTPLAWTAGTESSREVAYTIMNYLNAEAAGAPHRPRLDSLVTQALGHLDQWFVSKTAPYLQPFMAGLTMDALIQYDTAVGGDPRILPAIQSAVNSLWANNWMPGSQSFQYMDRDMGSLGGPTPANDLNMLIAPAYAWTYHKTGNAMYQQQADEILSGAVNGAYLNGAKQFNQTYMLAFDFMNWRNG